MKIKSFGCSFLAGSDLASPSHAWPALVSARLGVRHANHAIPGAGNLQILENVLEHASANSVNIVSWTWIDRFDFCAGDPERWQTLTPAAVDSQASYYYRNLQGQYRDMLTSLSYISTAVDHLETNNMCYWMTALDLLLFDPVDPAWHRPRAVTTLQKRLRPKIHLFESCTFLDWARQKGFAISDTWHPLEQAHTAAADIMHPVIADVWQHRKGWTE
jgi:hypothetical protein